MAGYEDSVVMGELKRLLDADWLQARAKEVGLVKRRRKIDVVSLVWTLVLGFGRAQKRSLTSLREAFERYSAVLVSRSSFYERLTNPLLVELLKQTYAHLTASTKTADTLSAEPRPTSKKKRLKLIDSPSSIFEMDTATLRSSFAFKNGELHTSRLIKNLI